MLFRFKMAASAVGQLNTIFTAYRNIIRCNTYSGYLEQVRHYAARKSTRERKFKIAQQNKARKASRKVIVPRSVKQMLREKQAPLLATCRKEDNYKSLPQTNVWISKLHQWKVFSFQEAVECHRETHHPTMYNLPDALLNAVIELNMQGVKKTKPLNSFTRIVSVPHSFGSSEDRNVIVFCKDPKMQTVALDLGATAAGGRELIKKIQSGDFSVRGYEFVLAHPDILPDLTLIRGLMKKDFPNIKTGTLSPDIKQLVMRFKKGVKYTANAHQLQKEYGVIDVAIGTLTMNTKQLEDNLISVLADVQSNKPKRSGSFVTRVRLASAPSPEQLKIDLRPFVPEEKVQEEDEGEEEFPDSKEAVIAPM